MALQIKNLISSNFKYLKKIGNFPIRITKIEHDRQATQKELIIIYLTIIYYVYYT